MEAAVLTEEEQIGSAKYLPRDLPPRLFEEERFLFPETYGVNRVRLLVKDPEWIFAHWDVDPRTLEALRSELGGRMVDVSRLTLRMKDPGDGAVTVTLLPPGARSWYFKVSPLRRSYHADLGFTLPSGAFRLLAESNIVVTPRVGPSSEKAARRVSYARVKGMGSLPPGGLGTAKGFTDVSSGLGPPARVADPGAGADSEPPSGTYVPGERGGASDVYRR